MPLRELTEQEKAALPKGDNISILGMFEEGARQINIGITESVPGLRPLAQKAGIAEEKGDDVPSPGQGALRMVGMGATMTAMILAAPLRAAAATGAAAFQQLARTSKGVQAGLGPSVAEFVKNTASSATTKPFSFLAVETTSAAGAGSLGAAIYEETGDPSARMVAELVGGTVPALTVPLIKTVAKASFVAQAIRGGYRAVTGKTLAAGKERAIQRIARATDDPRGSVARAESADVIERAPLTLAEKAEDPGLLSLEKSIRNSTDQLRRENRSRFAEINRVIREDLAGTETGEVSPAQAREYLDALIEERIRLAGVRLDERLSDLGPRLSSEQSSRLARVEIGKALDDAMAQEKELWRMVDPDIPAPLSKTMDAYRGVLARARQNRVARGRRDIPQIAQKHLGTPDPKTGKLLPGELNKNPTMGELQDLRSDLLDAAKRERAAKVPNRRKLSALGELQEAILEDMSKVDSDDFVAAARAYSADLNTRFRKGTVGDLLGYSVKGDPAIDASLTLQTTITGSKLKGATAVDDLIASVERTGDQDAMRSYMNDYVIDEFIRTSSKTGDFKPALGQAYINAKQDVLARMPETQRVLERAVKAGDELIAAKALTNPRASPAAIVLKSSPGMEIKAILSSSRPRVVAREVRTLLQTDPTGRAEHSFRQSLVDHLMEVATTKKADDAGVQILSGVALRDAMNNPAMVSLMDEFLSTAQLRNLRRVANTALKAERSASAEASVEGIMGDREGRFVSLARKVIAAGTGRNFARQTGMGGTVQIPGQFVQLSDDLHKRGLDPARQLIIDAVMSPDDKLLKSLLMEHPKTVIEAKMVYTQLNAWRIAVAAEYGISLAEE